VASSFGGLVVAQVSPYTLSYPLATAMLVPEETAISSSWPIFRILAPWDLQLFPLLDSKLLSQIIVSQ